VSDAFPDSVNAFRAELDRLRSELRACDAKGDRRGALTIIAEMIATQKEFMRRWPHHVGATGIKPASSEGAPKEPRRS
jgi:hypothetical protein